MKILFLSLIIAAAVSAQTPAPQPPAAAAGNAEAGKKLFVSYGCYQCHGYEAQGSNATGPRLGPRPIAFTAFSRYVRQPTGQMPPYTAKVVSDAELADIRAYLASIPDPTPAKDIPLLTQPILLEEADMVIGARPIDETRHFSWIKKRLQRLGSWAVRVASGTDVADAPSGFRAMSREVAMQLNVFGAYTYTLETIIQAGLNECRVISVPIRTNPDLRPSRLVRSISSYVRRSIGTIFRVFVVYRPMVLFMALGLLGTLVGVGAGLRFLYFYLAGTGGHVQSVVFSALSIILGTLLIMMGLIADLIAVNRKLSERMLLRVRRIELAMTKNGHNAPK